KQKRACKSFICCLLSHLIFETKTVCVGDNVTLTCARKGSGSLFWIRIVSGNFPQVLGKTYSLESVDPRFRVTEELGTFVLSIKKAKLSDATVYFCMKIHQQNFIFLKGTDLRVEGTEPDVTAVPTPDPVHTEASVSLQCSTLSETKLCPEEKCVCCFGAGAESHPSFNYTQGNSVCGYDKNPEGLSTKKCLCTFLKNVTSSDAGTYHCAVFMCGKILFGNGTKLDFEGNCPLFHFKCIYHKSSHKMCHIFCQRDEDAWVYSAVVYTMMEGGSGGMRDAKAAERKGIYDAVKAFGLDQPFSQFQQKK
uniref:Ig-like domain-containing protein n=1 Tax=Seriola dumerili TaxID=41447 RepID=A0A3B4TCU8_SERDU